jgi:hypothetical protein
MSNTDRKVIPVSDDGFGDNENEDVLDESDVNEEPSLKKLEFQIDDSSFVGELFRHFLDSFSYDCLKYSLRWFIESAKFNFSISVIIIKIFI